MSFSQLMSSMRFAITMLSFVGIASIIGTILKQKQPYESYIIKFGQFWFDIFRHLDLFNVYQAIWFLIILVFLITSTSLCVMRNSPGILRDYQKFQDKIREKSLRSFKHCYEISLPSFNKLDLISLLEKNNFKVREKKNTSNDLLIVAKKGSFQKLGYIFTHLAIIIISAGGLLDGNLKLKTQELLGLKEIQLLDLPLSEIPSKNRLESNNFSYRANVLLAEGEKQDVGVIPSKDGYLIQELPFSVGLKDFNIEHYSSGQPKSFESDLILTSKLTGKIKQQKISVNKPFTFEGVTIYQSDFQDGGTKLNILITDLQSNDKSQPMKAEIFKTNNLIYMDQSFSFEFDDFRLFNILDIDSSQKKNSKNVGPNFTYKIRNESGQANEYQTYQLPMKLDGRYFFVSGMRATPQEDFKFLKMPADAERALDGFLIFKNLLLDKEVIERAINQVILSSASSKDVNVNNLKLSTSKLFKTFQQGGYNQIALTIDKNIPNQEQESAASAYIKIIHLVANQVLLDYKKNNTLTEVFEFKDLSLFTQDALNAYSDSFFYGAPLFLELKDFEHVQASGLQLTKSPGKFWVYLGSIMLVIGIFCMIYVQEVRLWVLKKKNNKNILLTLTTNRHHLTFDKYADEIKNKINSLSKKG
jgi:cytochrome c biogenesis protein